MAKQVAKPIGEVTNGELISFQVWEFALDLEETLDETAIRPLLELPATEGASMLFVTQVRLACGKTYWAMLSNLDPQDADQTARYLALSFLKDEKRFHLARPTDFFYETHGPNALCDFLELRIGDVFPISYDIHSICKGDPAAVSGIIKL